MFDGNEDKHPMDQNFIDKKTRNYELLFSHLQKNQFVDPQFPHQYDKIYPKTTKIQKIHQVIWTPCEDLHHCSFYSYGNFTLTQLKNFKFISSNINAAIIIMKDFTPQIFTQLVKQRQLYDEYQNQKVKHFYQFHTFLSNQIQQIFIDSYVPVSEVRNQELFAQNTKGCIFPCLIEKLLAKICNGYHKINNLNLAQILQILTCYPKQQISLKQWQKSERNEPDIKKLYEFLENKLNVSKSLVFFKTRKNSKLIEFGLRPGFVYFMIGNFEKTQRNQRIILIKFLQLNFNQKDIQFAWIGKYSKHRFNTDMPLSQSWKEQLNEDTNFISLKDLIQVAQSFIILHNTQKSKSTHNIYRFDQISILPKYLSNHNQNYKIVEKKKNYLTQFQILQRQKIVTFKKQLTLQIKNKIQNTTNKNKALIIFRVFAQKVQKFQSLSFQKSILHLTILIWDVKKKKTIFLKSIKPKFKKIHNEFYYDVIYEFQSSFFQNENSRQVKVEIYLDCIKNMQQIDDERFLLKVSKFQNNQQQNFQNFQSLINIKGKPQNQRHKQEKILLNTIRQLMQQKMKDHKNTEQFTFQKHQRVEIFCYQFNQALGIGAILIKYKPIFQNQSQQSSKSKNQAVTVYIQMDNFQLLRNEVYLFQTSGLFLKEQDQNNESKGLLQKSKWRVSLNRIHQQFIIVFKIMPQLMKLQSKQFIFPPYNSVKISQLFSNPIK